MLNLIKYLKQSILKKKGIHITLYVTILYSRKQIWKSELVKKLFL